MPQYPSPSLGIDDSEDTNPGSYPAPDGGVFFQIGADINLQLTGWTVGTAVGGLGPQIGVGLAGTGAAVALGTIAPGFIPALTGLTVGVQLGAVTGQEVAPVPQDYPTLAGFIQWVRTRMGATPTDIPDGSIFFVYAYDVAIATVNPALGQIPPIYMLAVYNLGGDNLVNFCPDYAPSTFWSDLRKGYGTFDFAPGVVTSSSDNGTSTSLLNPDFMKEFTLANLQNLKSPYGRQYLAWAQAYGSLWGLT